MSMPVAPLALGLLQCSFASRRKGLAMSLWSKTIIDADDLCPRQGLWLRTNRPGGLQWPGYMVGSYVHAAIHAERTGAEGSAKEADGLYSRLSPSQMAGATRLLSNYEDMGFDKAIPEDAVYEQSFVFDMRKKEWSVAPDWAIRGDKWDPGRAKGTMFRIQPDVYYIDPEDGCLVIADWKTTLGIKSDSSLEKDTQAIIYSAGVPKALGLPDDHPVRFDWWNLRFKLGHRIERESGHWNALFLRIAEACAAIDDVDPEEREADYRAGGHCGTCKYREECQYEVIDSGDGDYIKVVANEAALPDDRLYKLSKMLDERASQVRALLRQRARERTSVLELDEGYVLGPSNTSGYRWVKDRKEEALAEVMRSVTEAGLSVFDFFDVKGKSLKSWIDALPEKEKEAVQGAVKETTRQSFITKKEADNG